MRQGFKLVIGPAGTQGERRVGARPHFALDRALLCADCSSLYEASGDQTCPSCGSRQAMSLARPLGRKVAS